MLHAAHQPGFLAVFWRPLDAWTWRHRSIGALAAALGAFVLGSQAWLAIEAPYRTRQREMIATLEKRLVQARAKVAALPAARRHGEASGQGFPAEPAGPAVPSARIAELVARSELQLVQLEPGAARAGAAPAASEEQALRLQARGAYAAMVRFAAGLASLPLAVVPGETRIRRTGEGLVLEIVLRVMGPQPAAAMPPEDTAALGADPFKPLGQGGAEDAVLGRLVGILSQENRRAALLAAADDFRLVRVGDALAGMTVAHIGASSITLVAAGASRTLALEASHR
jgi:hypothetical protein